MAAPGELRVGVAQTSVPPTTVHDEKTPDSPPSPSVVASNSTAEKTEKAEKAEPDSTQEAKDNAVKVECTVKEEPSSDIQEESIAAVEASSSAAAASSMTATAEEKLFTGDIVVERNDKLAYLQSAHAWTDLELKPELLKGIYEKGFVRPSQIQSKALPVIKNRENLIAQARNGSGKTATFALAMLSMTDFMIPKTQCICLCPTHELARQTFVVVNELGKYTAMRAHLAIPNAPLYDSSDPAHIIIGTPGKTQYLVQKRLLKLDKIIMFVLDEADVMIDREHNMSQHVLAIRNACRHPESVQVLLFSATFHERVRNFAFSMAGRHAARIVIRKEKLTLANVSQFYINTDGGVAQKMKILFDLYCSMTIGQSVIFVNNKRTAFELATKMTAEGHAVSLICGTQTTGDNTMTHAQREKVMSEFRNGETKVLVATDVLSRGIDVPQVTLVVNFDLPRLYAEPSKADTETYIHRIGRTGRFGLRGMAVNLVDETSNDMNLLDQIQEFYECVIQPLPMDPEEIEAMVRALRA